MLDEHDRGAVIHVESFFTTEGGRDIRGLTVVHMAPGSDRLTVTKFLREVLDHRTPLLYAIAVVAGATRAGDIYAAGSGVPAALLIGSVVGLGLFVLLCAIVWFTFRIRGL